MPHGLWAGVGRRAGNLEVEEERMVGREKGKGAKTAECERYEGPWR